MQIFSNVVTTDARGGKHPLIYSRSVSEIMKTFFGYLGKPNHVSTQPGLIHPARVSARIFKTGLEALMHANRIGFMVLLPGTPIPNILTTDFAKHIRHLSLFHNIREGDGSYEGQVHRFTQTLEHIGEAATVCPVLKSLVVIVDMSPDYWREWSWSESGMDISEWVGTGFHLLADLATVTMTLRSLPKVSTFLEFKEDMGVPELRCDIGDFFAVAVPLLKSRGHFRDSSEPASCEENIEMAKAAAEEFVRRLDFQDFKDDYKKDSRIEGTVWEMEG